MRKDELIKVLLKLAKQSSKSQAKRGSSAAKGRTRTTAALESAAAKKKRAARSAAARKVKRQNARIVKIIREETRRREQLKDLTLVHTTGSPMPPPKKDRVVLIVRDPYWLQVLWEITQTTVKRAHVALAENWHNAQPVIRLLEIIDEGSTHTVEQIVRDIPVHGGVRNWYIDVMDPPKTYRVALGYKTAADRFHLIAKSNKITTPIPSTCEAVDNHWTDIADNYQKFYAMSGGYSENGAKEELKEVFEQQLRRPMTTPSFAQFGGAQGNGQFCFSVDAEMIIYGSADPNANVTLAGEPVKLDGDGSFSVRMSMPDRRLVLPVVASSRDGSEQRTTVLAIERNTKIMEPISRDPEEG